MEIYDIYDRKKYDAWITPNGKMINVFKYTLWFNNLKFKFGYNTEYYKVEELENYIIIYEL